MDADSIYARHLGLIAMPALHISVLCRQKRE